MKKRFNEAIQMFDTGDTRSFSDIYEGREDLFEDSEIDNIISPRMKALFESTYSEANRLREEIGGDASSNPNHNFSGGEGKPSGDGVCDGHNSSLLGGEDPCTTQGQGRGDSNNAKLFDESLMKEIWEKSQLKESFEEDDFDPEYDLLDDDDFSSDAVDENEIEFDNTEIDPIGIDHFEIGDDEYALDDDFSLGSVDGDDGESFGSDFLDYE
jgi:hypothetical protein